MLLVFKPDTQGYVVPEGGGGGWLKVSPLLGDCFGNVQMTLLPSVYSQYSNSHFHSFELLYRACAS